VKPGAAVVSSYGSVACFSSAPRRRLAELDRTGTLTAAMRWEPDGRLASATTRLPAGGWLTIEPRATREAPWGLSDRLWAGAQPHLRAVPLTLFEAVDYGRVTVIPTLADPPRVPGGGGTAVLNMIAALAVDAGTSALAYRGPYPSEQLFLALLESFRYEPGAAQPLDAFTRRQLSWRPAPHERLFAPDGTYVQWRGRVEKVVRDGRTYVRPDWQGVGRHAPHRVRDVAGGVVCSLVVLETIVEDHLLLAGDGGRVRVLETARSLATPSPMPPALVAGIVAMVVARSAWPLAPFIRAAGAAATFEWGPVERDLISVHGATVRVSSALPAVAATRLRAPGERGRRLEIGLAVLAEIAGLAGDALRARAQSALLALSETEQLAALSGEAGNEDAADARRITQGVEALLAACASEGSDHEPGVEDDEGGDRHR
jgi:hypothetical protein